MTSAAPTTAIALEKDGRGGWVAWDRAIAPAVKLGFWDGCGRIWGEEGCDSVAGHWLCPVPAGTGVGRACGVSPCSGISGNDGKDGMLKRG